MNQSLWSLLRTLQAATKIWKAARQELASENPKGRILRGCLGLKHIRWTGCASLQAGRGQAHLDRASDAGEELGQRQRQRDVLLQQVLRLRQARDVFPLHPQRPAPCEGRPHKHGKKKKVQNLENERITTETSLDEMVFYIVVSLILLQKFKFFCNDKGKSRDGYIPILYMS